MIDKIAYTGTRQNDIATQSETTQRTIVIEHVGAIRTRLHNPTSQGDGRDRCAGKETRECGAERNVHSAAIEDDELDVVLEPVLKI